MVIHIYKGIQFPHKNMIFINMSRAELVFNINKEKESERERERDRKKEKEREREGNILGKVSKSHSKTISKMQGQN